METNKMSYKCNMIRCNVGIILPHTIPVRSRGYMVSECISGKFSLLIHFIHSQEFRRIFEIKVEQKQRASNNSRLRNFFKPINYYCLFLLAIQI